MAFALFCVLNVMTGVFVENASKMTSADEERRDGDGDHAYHNLSWRIMMIMMVKLVKF